jgi:hypothetical protein
MPYNMSYVGNSTDLLTLTQRVNETLMLDMLGVLFLMAVFCVAFIAFYQSTLQSGKAFLASSFICAMLSILLMAVSLLPAWAVFLAWTSTAIGLALVWREA